MSKISGTFEELWQSGMEANAKDLGVLDGDLATVRSKVKNLLIRAGWAQSDGSVGFVSDLDHANALQACRKELNAAADKLVSERKVVRASAVPGSTPTKEQVLSASSNVPQEATLYPSAIVDASSALPKIGHIGDRCPRCSASMQPVGLANNKAALYCTQDRVVVPLASDITVR